MAGLTKFKCLENWAGNDSFSEEKESERELRLFFIQCLFEAQIKIDFETAFGSSRCMIKAENTLFSNNSFKPLDLYALSHCIAKYTTDKSAWNILLHNVKDLSIFTHGLSIMSYGGSGGIIEKLSLLSCSVTTSELLSCPLHSLTVLILSDCNLNNTHMVELAECISHSIPCLKKLDISNNNLKQGQENGLLKVLQQLSNSMKCIHTLC